MNIFILSYETDPQLHIRETVESMIDKHIVKMVAESTQMLVTAIHANLQKQPAWHNLSTPCRPLSQGMAKHPYTLWTADNFNNFAYLARLALAMCNEHQHRYPLSPQHSYMPWLRKVCDLLNEYENADTVVTNFIIPTHFAVAIGDPYKQSTYTPHQEAVDIYRNYYVQAKHGFATWKRRAKPMWFLLREELLTEQGRLR